VAYDAEGRRIASVAYDSSFCGEIKVWNAGTGKELLALRGPKAFRPIVPSVAFSPDGRRLVTNTGDKTAQVWDATTGQEVFTLRGHTDSLLRTVFSPDGQRIASASDDNTVRIWDADSGQEVLTLIGHTREVVGVAFSPDGHRLATGSCDRTVKIWDAATGQEILTLRGHTMQAFGVAFSPDGQRLASSSADETVRVWEAAPLTAELRLQREAGRLVRRLVDDLLFKDEVIARLRQTPMNEPVRQQALALAERDREDPHRFSEASWAVVRRPGGDEAGYHRALRLAEYACQRWPDTCTGFHPLAVAQFRLGQYQEVLRTLVRIEELHAKRKAEPDAWDLAILAMSQHQLGQKEQAPATLQRLRQLMQEPRWARNAISQDLLREAEGLIEGQAVDPKK
jgi:hypothetical protein